MGKPKRRPLAYRPGNGRGLGPDAGKIRGTPLAEKRPILGRSNRPSQGLGKANFITPECDKIILWNRRNPWLLPPYIPAKMYLWEQLSARLPTKSLSMAHGRTIVVGGIRSILRAFRPRNLNQSHFLPKFT